MRNHLFVGGTEAWYALAERVVHAHKPGYPNGLVLNIDKETGAATGHLLHQKVTVFRWRGFWRDRQDLHDLRPELSCNF
jgi:hypothetical protein